MSALDTACLLRAAAAAGLRLGFSRLRGGDAPSPRVPRKVEEITAAWLAAALAEGGEPSGFSGIEHIQGHSGTTTRSWIQPGYDGDPPPGAPTRFFLKVAPHSFPTAVFGEILGLGRNEIRFYDELACEVPVDVPQAFVARYDAASGAFVLVLEDLAADVVFPSFEHPCTFEQFASVISELARLHAAFWGSPRFERDLAWLPRAGNDPAYRLGKAISELSTRPALAKLRGRVSNDFATRAARIHQRRDLLEKAWAKPPLTLVHGDAHLGNLYFRAGKPGFFDWQIVSARQGMRDVAHLMVGGLDVDDRRSWERDLIALYVDELRSLGVAEFSVDDAWRQYRLHAFYEWFGLTVTVAGDLQPAVVQDAVLGRAVAAIEDLQSFDAIEELR